LLVLEVRGLRRLLGRIEEACAQMKLPTHDVVVHLHVDQRRAVVVPKLWQERESWGGHQDEPRPVIIDF